MKNENVNTVDSSTMLGTESIGKLLLKFSIPAMIGMIVNALYSIVDAMFIGQYVGSLALGGVSIASPVIVVFLAFTMLIGIGATSLISIRLGEGKNEDAEKILGNATTLLVIMPIILFIITQVFLDRILIVFGASEALLPYARTYMSVVSFGFIFQSIGFGMNNFIRSEGKPKIAMYTMLIGATINIGLDALFIIKFNMGVKGAALATVLAEIVPAILVLGYFITKRSTLRLRKENLRLKFDIVRYILTLGFAQFAMQLANSVVAIVANNTLLKYGGDLAIPAYRIISNASLIVLMPIFGINQGMQPIIGYNYGAQQFKRVKKTLFISIGAGSAIAIVGFLVTRFFPEQIAIAFNKNDPELIKLTTAGIKLFFMALPVIGFQIIGSNYFQAIGKPKQATLLGLLRQVIILIPATIILPMFLDLKGVWIAAPTADFLASVVTAIFIVIGMKELNKGIKVQDKL